jgi:tRNA wybutosine-synthesizing protein 1
MAFTKEEQAKLEYSGYRFVGEHGHAAAKICHWTRKSMVNEGVCYKEQFYGVQSHRCLQMSPAVPFCNQKCSFCWRDLSQTRIEWEGEYDDPKTIIEGAIKAQNNLLCGFGGNKKADKKKLEESKKPTNAAISLAGEPTLYPEIDELLAEFHRQDFTTFLVSNGMYWEKLGSLENEPTQLYVSLDAPNEKVYKELCNPQINDAWSNLNKTLELMNSFDSRTAIRITSVKGKNMINTDEYAKLINEANPKYVEVKAYMFVGSSRKRLSLDNMPSNQEVRDFALEIADKTGRELTKESEVSRVVLLE